MPAHEPTEFTSLLSEWRNGDAEAGARLAALVYQDLRRLARQYMRQERQGHTLQPTALVHEVYLRLFSEGAGGWRDRTHFFAVAARQMRRILVDHARTVHAEKRDGGRTQFFLEGADQLVELRSADLVVLGEALCRLEELSPRASQIVDLRFFSGLTEKETAEALGISVATLKRDWTFAKAWLYAQLSGPDLPDA